MRRKGGPERMPGQLVGKNQCASHAKGFNLLVTKCEIALFVLSTDGTIPNISVHNPQAVAAATSRG